MGLGLFEEFWSCLTLLAGFHNLHFWWAFSYMRVVKWVQECFIPARNPHHLWLYFLILANTLIWDLSIFLLNVAPAVLALTSSSPPKKLVEQLYRLSGCRNLIRYRGFPFWKMTVFALFFAFIWFSGPLNFNFEVVCSVQYCYIKPQSSCLGNQMKAGLAIDPWSSREEYRIHRACWWQQSVCWLQTAAF